MENKFYNYYKDIPPIAKGVVVVGGLAIAAYAGYTLIKRIRKSSELKADLKESETAQDDLNELIQQGKKPTISSSQAEGICNSLVEAMNDCGTDEDAVYNQFKKLNNLSDVLLLVLKWGIRYYRPCAASAPISYSKYLFNERAFGGNISAWLNYDMTQSEIQKINKILSDKGINYKF